MFTILLVAGALAAVGYRAMTPEERTRAFERYVVPAAAAIDRVVWAIEPFRRQLRTRTPWLIAVPVIAGLTILTFAALVAETGAVGVPDTLVAWGAGYGPRTTAGEPWRLVTALFVHVSVLHLLCTVVALVQLGELLERVLGPLAVACVFLIAGAGAGVVAVVDHPMAVHAGASAAVLGLHGALLAVTLWGALSTTGLLVPLPVFQSLLPGTALFLAYEIAADTLASRSHLTGLTVGFTLGLALAKDAGTRVSGRRPLALAGGVAAVMLGYLGLTLPAVVDVRPVLAEIVVTDDRLTGVYRTAVVRFTKQRRAADSLVLSDLIERTILPRLQLARRRLAAVDGIRDDDQAAVETAFQYLHLRERSWQVRADGLRTRNMQTLLGADTAERAALNVLARLRDITSVIDVRT